MLESGIWIINNLIRDENYKKIIKKNNKLSINLNKRPEELKFEEIINLYKLLN